ncbi:NAD-dependent epimerase/dehydratase family protein [Longispora albida]|uniref:NAD-dependent epimerase/dehydratase family protein n=1 Tax=Longispora albida TaxID=203523 RepID=UPI00035E8EE4|nr:NAD-dependent epimerase/dehydratase family protein [Longispora albida]
MRNVLILGGTKFLGRAITEAALGRGDQVTLFNRGQTNPGLYPEAETIIGDRHGDLSALTARSWDVVIDVAGYEPEVVARSTVLDTGRYVFVSTISVYASHKTPNHEEAPVLEYREGLDLAKDYGSKKVLCEREVQAAYGDRALIVRPGLIVGPHDPTDRFGYFPRRIATGPRPVMAPGTPDGWQQFIDVRDLGEWIAGTGAAGVFNLAGDPVPMGGFLALCGAEPGDVTWVPSAKLHAAGVDRWFGVPLWIGSPDAEAANLVPNAKALADGLKLRPLADTIRDHLAWDLGRGGPAKPGLTPEEEARLLAL